METSKNYGKITVDSVKVGMYDKPGFMTAQLRQVVHVTTSYPDRVQQSLGDNLFPQTTKGSTYTNEENRVVWQQVPIGSTVQTVEQKLKQYPNLKIKKIVSNRPILTDAQEYSISIGQKTMDDYAGSQIVKDGTGKIVTENGLKYKVNVLSFNGEEDEKIMHDEEYTPNFLQEFYEEREKMADDMPF